MRVGFVESSTIISRTSIPTIPENGIENAAERLSEMALKNPLMSSSNIVGIGISTAGPINPKTGVYNHPPNLHGWHNKTMKPLFKKKIGSVQKKLRLLKVGNISKKSENPPKFVIEIQILSQKLS